ncbi:MAG: mechanosensitive ion channel family protein [Candidatus Thermoplasmatota archaeon]|nr:mechanosensitive ion channel family protein [Candidatus Thermoplasmatota archaeon]
MNIWESFKDVLELKIGGITTLNIFTFIFIILISAVIGKVVRTNLHRFFKEKVPITTLVVMEKIVHYVIIFIGFMVALPYIGFSLSGLLVAGGILGIVIGFASQTVVSNLISGIFLMIERPMAVGDGVNIGDVSGIVKDIKILSTTVRTYDGIYVRIPNDKVFSSNIQNYVVHEARRFNYSIGIRYKDDAEKAMKIVEGLLDAHPLVLKEPAPTIFVEELGESSVNLTVKIWAPSSHWYGVYTEMLWKIKVALEKEGIEIPFPQRVVWMAGKDGK